jgi:VCBS repeat protein
MSFFTQPFFALDAFGQRRGGGGWATQNRYPRELGDVNGDGHADIVGFGADGVYVSVGNADGSFNTPFFAAAGFAHDRGGWETQNQYPRQLGDVNGDGRDDIVGFGDGGVYVSLANADGTFGQSVLALNAFARAAGGWTSQDHYPREVADVNGDGRADIVGFGASGVYVALGNVSGTFAQPFLAINAFSQGVGGWTSQDRYTRELGDVNGDGRADIVGFGSAGVYVSLANTDGTFAADPDARRVQSKSRRLDQPEQESARTRRCERGRPGRHRRLWR